MPFFLGGGEGDVRRSAQWPQPGRWINHDGLHAVILEVTHDREVKFRFGEQEMIHDLMRSCP